MLRGRKQKVRRSRRTNAVFAEHYKNKKIKKKTICSTEQSKEAYFMPSLFKFRTTQPPEIGAMAKIILLHRVAYKKATPSPELKIRNRPVESRLQKSLTALQILNVCLGFK
ncbi:hypothetical protein AVEN_66804-1 [Araneus ventricosus]|uniref:Uncharacterized protein n=1 Tax=Araneus ventricosus TaxID=182803 RepID=A0A4Y2DQD3_ARAVE|nr:hypothetical protein AVEN_66804-1 [Araneus ventricosus]